jgi:hypothetical protein
VQNTEKQLSHLSFEDISPRLKFLVSLEGFGYIARREEKKKKKVGRVVSLSIDLHGISELDRDAVIALSEEKKNFLFMSRVALRVQDFPERNFLIRCISMQALVDARKTRFFFDARFHGHFVSLHIFN